MAAAKVFTTPELLQQILQHLHPIQYYNIQRSSTTFKDIEKTSSLVQRAMFLKSTSVDSLPSMCALNALLRGFVDLWLPTATIKVKSIKVAAEEISVETYLTTFGHHHVSTEQSWRRTRLASNSMPLYFIAYLGVSPWSQHIRFTMAGHETLGELADVVGRYYCGLVGREYVRARDWLRMEKCQGREVWCSFDWV